jgi:hypothetical protein
MRVSTFPVWQPLFCVALTAVLAGCGSSGPSLAPVTGRVTIDGRPVENIEVIFQPKQGSPSFGVTGHDGRYELIYKRGVSGALIGEHTVQIKTMPVTEGGKPTLSIPARYNTKTELHQEVKTAKNVFDFDLKSDAK